LAVKPPDVLSSVILHRESDVAVDEFFDLVVSEFESLAPRRVTGLGISCRQRGLGTGPLGGLDGFNDVGLGVDRRPSNPSGAGRNARRGPASSAGSQARSKPKGPVDDHRRAVADGQGSADFGSGGAKLLRGGLQELVPGDLELVDALVLEDDEHVGQVDPDGSELVEDLL
jgi:hypothetical protein